MKAKDVAGSINQIVAQKRLQESWDSIFEKMKAGASDEDLAGDALALQQSINESVSPLATDYLGFLLQSVGQQMKDKALVKTASARACVLSADQAWRAFHARLVPVAARAVDPEAFKSTVAAKTPRIAQLTWPPPPSKGDPFPPFPTPRFR